MPTALLIYSGPTARKPHSRHDRNFLFFLRHGLPCAHPTPATTRSFSTTIVLTNETAAFYAPQLRCAAACGRLTVLRRVDRCYDMESLRVAHNLVQSCEGLEHLPRLEHLDLRENHIRGELGLRLLCFNRGLRSLWVEGCVEINW